MGASVIGVAVVGCGYWGPNLVRNLSALPECEVRAVCDPDPARLAQVCRRYPAVRGVAAFDDLLRDPAVDAVALATPVRTHYPLARAALEAGRHVLVEKPFTDSTETAARLVDLAAARKLTLQVDFPFVYGGAVQKIRSLIDSGDLGRLLYFDSVRVNLGLFQSDVNVLWDLATHDVSIALYLMQRTPQWVSAVGSAHYGPLADVAYVTMQFDDALIGHAHVNWLAPVKLRSVLIGGSERMVVYDDLEPSEKVRVYAKGVTLNGDRQARTQALVDYRLGDMWAPHIDKTEPLEHACRDFLRAVDDGRPPLTDGHMGLEVVRILAAAERSMESGGARVAP
jgi:predicted dehydrogenase